MDLWRSLRVLHVAGAYHGRRHSCPCTRIELGYPEEPYDATGHYRMRPRSEGELPAHIVPDSGPPREAPAGRSSLSAYTQRRIMEIPAPPLPVLNTARKPAAGTYDRGGGDQTAVPFGGPKGRMFKRRRQLSPLFTPPSIMHSPTVHPPTVHPALTNLALAPTPLVPIRPRISPRWALPVLRKESALERTICAAEMACSLSITHTEAYPAFDGRLRERELARRDDDRTHSAVEVYYNDERTAALPKILILMLERQVEFEDMEHIAHTQLPGTGRYPEYLRVHTLPADSAVLHQKYVHPHAAWEYFIAIGYEILSHHISSLTVRELSILAPTPVHLQVIPYSSEYRLHPEDLYVRFQAAVRQVIQLVLKGMVSLARFCSDFNPRILNEYLAQREIRETWARTSELPRTYFVTTTPALPLICPNDYLSTATDYHPLMHDFEVKFLRRACLELIEKRASRRYRDLATLIKSFTRMNSPYQGALSRLLLSHILEQTGEIEVFAPEEEDDFYPSSVSSRPVTPSEYRALFD
ncbi:hypothetical protein B0H17DRAFT_1289948 [Mycena rosella]|uniref:Uncharacterized protein n=1 Tax=Mycena rosella TaxID=1033263 RepID=A0AAD7DFX8_MYCRO|nr:hypothetical protein B0H17DRAFT_1289948 [Mycena rosella]